MRIAIFGSRASREEVEPLANDEHFDAVCSALGEVLGSAGHTLVVESDRPRTADASVVAGIRRLDPALLARVEAWHRTRMKANGAAVREPFANDPWVIKVPVPVAHVGPAHMRMLGDVHLVIVVGGGNNAYVAGQAARAMDIRLVPVAAFGGAGRLLWQEMHDGRGPSNARTMNPDLFRQLATVGTVVPAIQAEVASHPRIMVVHGRSNDKDAVAEMLQRLGATPVVMKDSFVAGETIQDEFERLALQADGAVVVVTGDDAGRATIGPDGTPITATRSGARARQNVILEYGWFWCRFGRRNVALLVRGDEVELPSDVSGVLYHRYEATPNELDAELRHFVDRLR